MSGAALLVKVDGCIREETIFGTKLRGVVGGLWRAQVHRSGTYARRMASRLLDGDTTTACERVPVETARKKLSPVKSSMYLQFPLLSSLLMHLIFSWCVGYVWLPKKAMM